MTERLKEKLRRYLIRRGPTAKAELSLAVKKSPRMIERYLNGSSNPSQHTGYNLALACGCSDEEALEIAKELSSMEAKETA